MLTEIQKWIRVFSLAAFLLLTLVSFQNCRNFESSQGDFSTKLSGGDGGDNYDGKPTEGTYVHEVLQYSCGGKFSQYEQQVISISKLGAIDLDAKSLLTCSDTQKNLNTSDLEYYSDAKGYFSYRGAIFKHKNLLRKEWVTELWCRPVEGIQTNNNIFIEYSPLYDKAELTYSTFQRMPVQRKISGSQFTAENENWNLLVNLDSEVFLGSRKYIGEMTNKGKNTKIEVNCFSGANTLPKITFKRMRSYPSHRSQYLSISASQNSVLSLDWLLNNFFDENNLSISQKYFKSFQNVNRDISIHLTNLSNGKELELIHPLFGWTYYGSYMVDDENLVLVSVNLDLQDLSLPNTEQSRLPMRISHFRIIDNKLKLQNEFDSSTLLSHQNLLEDRRNFSRLQIFLSSKTVQWVSISDDFRLMINSYSATSDSLKKVEINLNEFLPDAHFTANRVLNITNAFDQKDLYKESVRQLPGSLWRIMSRRSSSFPLVDQLPRSMEKVIYAEADREELVSVSDWNTETFHNKFEITGDQKIYYFVDQMDSPENGVFTKYKIYKFEASKRSVLEVSFPGLQNFIVSEVTYDSLLNRLYVIAVDHLNRFSDYSRSMFIIDPDTLGILQKIPVYRYEYRQYYLTTRPELAYLLKTKVSSTSSRLDSVYIRDLSNFNYDFKVFDFRSYFSTTELQSIYFNADLYESLSLDSLFLVSAQYLESDLGLVRKNNLYELNYSQGESKVSELYKDLSFAEGISSSRLVLTKGVGSQTSLLLFDINQKKEMDLMKNVQMSESERIFNIGAIPNSNAMILLTQSIEDQMIYLNFVSVDGL